MRRHNSLKKTTGPLQQYNDPMTRVDPFQKYPDVFKQIIDWSKDPMVRPENQNKYFFSDGKTYYEQICKMLKLMSVFKDAFQQIYDNEDEIHEAWDNFVDNLTATAEYGEEVRVTLTWTEESVNFDFTIPGGEDGTGIQSIVFNADYTMTITLTDGTTYTSPSLRGETGATGATGPQGPAGPQGPQGEGLHILDVYPTLADLQQAHPTGSPGDAYEVGSDPTYTLYVWSASQSAWVSAGSLGSVAPSNTNPLMDGTASPGISDYYSRGDHVHPTDTSRASQSDLNTVSGNLSTLSGQVSDIATAVDIVEDMVDDLSDIIQESQSLIDQQFLYRESLADHDAIGRLDNIKGNTFIFNQLAQLVPTKTVGGITFTNNNDGSMTISGTSTASSAVVLTVANPSIPLISGHKYILLTGQTQYEKFRVGNYDYIANGIFTAIATETARVYFLSTIDEVYNFKVYIMVCDLTKMGLDYITSVNQFTSLYSLPFYDFTLGKLLPFKGESLKTTGKNQLPLPVAETKDGVTLVHNTDGSITLSGTATRTTYFDFFPNGDFDTTFFAGYVFSFGNVTFSNQGVAMRLSDSTRASLQTITNNSVLNDLGRDLYLAVRVANNYTIPDGFTIYPMMRKADTSANFEPYISSTIDLSVLEHFPTGMKDCSQSSQVFDERTESKDITRVGSVDLGSLDWTLYNIDSGTKKLYRSTNIADCKASTDASVVPNIICAKYPTVAQNSRADKTLSMQTSSSAKTFDIIDNDIADASAFKQAMNGQYLYFELENATEQSVSPALDMTFKAWKGGTEQILPENTSDPYTAPIRTDMTYMSTDEAVLYLKDHAVTDPTVIDDIEDLQDDVSDLQTDVGNLQTDTGNLQTDVGTLQTDVGTIQTQIGSETTTPMSGILGRLNTDESNISSMQSTVTDLDNYADAFASTGSTTSGIRITSAVQSVTLDSGESKFVTIPKAPLSGYTYIGIYGFSCGDNNVLISQIQYSLVNETVGVRLKNTASYQTTVTVSVDLTFLKNYSGGN